MTLLRKVITVLICIVITLSNVLWQFKTASADVFKESENQVLKTNQITSYDTAINTNHRILIKYKDGYKTDTIKETVKRNLSLSKIDTKKHFSQDNLELLEIGDSDNIANVIAALEKDPNILYAQEDYLLYSSTIPSDVFFEQQWGLMNSGQEVKKNGGIPNVDVDAVDAWSLTQGNSVIVGVLDTGINIEHNDLQSNIWLNPNEIANGIDDDGNGYVDDINGWDFASNDNTVFDLTSEETHGTQVSGVIAADSNDIGISGIAPDVKIVPLKFINGGYGYTSDAIEAIEYAEKMGIRIINCSWGASAYNPALYDIMQNTDILFVCAAGNNSQDVADESFYPACFDLSNIISVAAVDNRGNLASFSNYGSSIDVALPGVDILSTISDSNYSLMSGTSMSAAYATGIAALLYSLDNNLSPLDIKSKIIQSSDKYEQLAGKVASEGIPNAFIALGGNVSEARICYSDIISTQDVIVTEDTLDTNLVSDSLDDTDIEELLLPNGFLENMQQWAMLTDENSSDYEMVSSTGSSIAVNKEENVNADINTSLLRTAVNVSSSFYKLDPVYLNTNFTFEMMSATVTEDEHNFKNIGCFRTRSDLCGMTWETKDTISHMDLRYPTNSDFSNVHLQYDYDINGSTALMDATVCPTLTITTNNGEIYYVRLWNYVINRPLDEWEIGISTQNENAIVFPAGRVAGDATGSSGKISIDFDNLYAGWTPYISVKKLVNEDEENPIYEYTWIENPDWIKVPVDNIDTIMWSFVPQNYNQYSSPASLDYLSSSMEYEVNFSNWYVTGNTYLGEKSSDRQVTDVRMCDDYDDIYNMTPARVVNEYKALGYEGIVNFYIGASHYYDKKYNNGAMEVISDYPFNCAFEEWYRDYLTRLKANNTDVISSISMESVDAPSSWWQRAWDGTAATTNWTPTPHLLSFVNYDVKIFYKSLVQNLSRLSSEQGLIPKIQLGEPWWWYIEIGSEKIPCFYDSATQYQFSAEMGYTMPVFKTCDDPVDGYGEVLQWLQKQNGDFSLFLRDSIKQLYPSAEFSVLFFPPSVIDKDRVPLMMSIVNFPKEQWQYPNLDFFMLEDYDYLIEGSLDKHRDALTFVQENLGYPESKIHYFSGFVLNESSNYVWSNINQAINDSINQGFAETYVWAYAQVKRDGWEPPQIIRTDHPSGHYSDQFYTSFSCAGAGIIYTTNGTTPSLTNGVAYYEPVYISNNTTVKAVAVVNGVVGNVVSFHYTTSMTEPQNMTINIDGSSEDWNSLGALCIGQGNIMDLTAAQDAQKLYLLVRGTNMNTTSNFYIDTDESSSTGYHVWAWYDSGADYMLQDNELYEYTGTGGDWAWSKITTATVSKSYLTVEAAINLADLNLSKPSQIKVAFGRDYQEFVPRVGKKMATVYTEVANLVSYAEEIWLNLEMIQYYQNIIDAPIIGLLTEETPTPEDVEKYKLNLRHVVQYLQLEILENPLIDKDAISAQYLAQNIIDGNGISALDDVQLRNLLIVENPIIAQVFEEYLHEEWLECASLLLNLVPIIGSAKAIAEGIVGYDLLTGRQYCWWERVMSVTMGSVSLVGEVGLLAVAMKDSRLALKLSEVAVIAKNVSVKIVAEAISEVEKFAPLLKTERSTAFFWSGRTNGIGGAERALEIAGGKGGTTLENIIETKGINMPEWNINDPKSIEMWRQASAKYAEQASGEVRAVIGSNVRPDSVWLEYELPALESNTNVTKITTIDPETLVETIIFER
ncbi:MAG: S8 family serine peptidase [Mobilitalea sp.]